MAQGIPGYGKQVCVSAPAGQCDSSWAASQAGRQVSVGGSFFWLWLAGLVQSCGALAAQPGWLVCVEVSFFFSLQSGTGLFAPVLRWGWPSRS